MYEINLFVVSKDTTVLLKLLHVFTFAFDKLLISCFKEKQVAIVKRMPNR